MRHGNHHRRQKSRHHQRTLIPGCIPFLLFVLNIKLTLKGPLRLELSLNKNKVVKVLGKIWKFSSQTILSNYVATGVFALFNSPFKDRL